MSIVNHQESPMKKLALALAITAFTSIAHANNETTFTSGLTAGAAFKTGDDITLTGVTVGYSWHEVETKHNLGFEVGVFSSDELENYKALNIVGSAHIANDFHLEYTAGIGQADVNFSEYSKEENTKHVGLGVGYRHNNVTVKILHEIHNIADENSGLTALSASYTF